MSCESSTNKISKIACKLSAGISSLPGKRGFYAGLALGGAGIVGAGLLAAARRQSKPVKPKQAIAIKDIPQLPTRVRVKPTSPHGQVCADCRSPAGSKPGPWYNVGGRPYCPDCAPDKAREIDVDLVASAAKAPAVEIVGGNGRQRSSRPIPAVGPRAAPVARALPPERAVNTKLFANRVRVRLGDGAKGPIWHIMEDAYVVLRQRDGMDTGLAVTPALEPQGDGWVEDKSGWFITHISSGRVFDGPYANPEEAHQLARTLAQLDWTRPEEELNTDELRRAGATATIYRQALGKPGGNQQSSAVNTLGSTSLEGKLLADGYGGVSRVVEDNGNTLFMIDNLGSRYEVARGAVRLPDQQDFEMSRVAMPLDPAKERATCSGCGQSTQQSAPDERWHRMGWKVHCEGCGRKYAAKESYILSEEVGSELW